ncbi:MAG TPA: ribosome-associated translation inhibitor RaiA [Methylomirabilota bacterium]|nr:ribosome-associated translation inhibitor RaiA [Methylomirabilota bacterium]
MQLNVKGKHLDIGDALRVHVEESLQGVFGKYFGNPIDANVVLSREAHLYRAQISVRIGRGISMQSQADAEAPYAAYDVAADNLAKRLRRYKRRLRDHHRTEAPTEPAAQYILAGDTAEGDAPVEDSNGAPVIIAEMSTDIPTLSVGEAVMRLDLSSGVALMFRNRAHGELNMVYRRPDGTIGWVDPRGNASA